MAYFCWRSLVAKLGFFLPTKHKHDFQKNREGNIDGRSKTNLAALKFCLIDISIEEESRLTGKRFCRRPEKVGCLVGTFYEQ